MYICESKYIADISLLFFLNYHTVFKVKSFEWLLGDAKIRESSTLLRCVVQSAASARPPRTESRREREGGPRAAAANETDQSE